MENEVVKRPSSSTDAAQRIARRIVSKIDIYGKVEWDTEMIDKVADIITTELATAQVAGEPSDAAEICAEMAREADRCTEAWHVEGDKFGNTGPEAEKVTRYAAMADALREAERRIRAASTSFSAWREIASAPKDGTEVLLWVAVLA